MTVKRPLNIGAFEVLLKVKQYENYLEFLDDYSRDTPNSEGVRIDDWTNESSVFFLVRSL